MKDIFLDYRSVTLQWYGSIHKHGDTWVIFIPNSQTLYKGNPMGYWWKIQIISSEMMSQRIYRRKQIAKILNVKIMFVPDCYYFKSIVRADINDGYIDLYNIMNLFHPLLTDESMDCNIMSQKNSMYLPYHVENILTYVER